MHQIERSPLDATLLRTFAIIAECGNLTVAAGRLHRTQSAISVQLKRLEADLGAVLFERRPQGMRVTPAGERLLPKAHAALAALDDARSLFETPMRGRVRVGIPDDYDGLVLETALATFTRMHPEVDVEIVAGCTSGYGNAITEGQLDVAVASGPEPSGGTPLGTEHTVWASADAVVPAEGPIRVVMLDRGCWWKDMTGRALERLDREHRIVFASASFAGVLSALRAGLGVGVIPRSCIGLGLRILNEGDGFSDLPAYQRTLLIAPDAPSDGASAAMAEAIEAALR